MVPMRQENDCVPERHQPDERLSADYLREKYKILMADEFEVSKVTGSSSRSQDPPVAITSDGRYAYRSDPNEQCKVYTSNMQRDALVIKKNADELIENNSPRKVYEKSTPVTSGISGHDVAVWPDVQTGPSQSHMNNFPRPTAEMKTVKSICPKIDAKEQ
ncbi:hypothetical protein FSP39_003315 [Pinctada imbricata]|uniref:Uncharacterized protein n=1 Tax=Pinctada imbricata TaxID=66713 RepID=A0AA89BLF1_PINIB|nr:hypothetical protein FSP39_003315 [Pinctada imbricata]